jgi:hypothetical protein
MGSIVKWGGGDRYKERSWVNMQHIVTQSRRTEITPRNLISRSHRQKQAPITLSVLIIGSGYVGLLKYRLLRLGYACVGGMLY